MLSSLNSLMDSGTEKPDYLNLDKVVIGEDICCVAYVLYVELRMARSEKGFAAFYLKDENANLAVARLFNVEDYLNSASVAKAFEGRPVKFRARVQEYNGNISLVIDGSVGVEPYAGDFEYGKFIGSVSSDLEFASGVYDKLFPDKSMPVGLYKTYSVRFLAQGRLGAYGKLVEMSFMSVSSVGEMPGIDESVLLRTFFAVMEEYYNVLLIYYQNGHQARIMLYESYKSVAQLYDKSFSLIVIDTLQAMFENKKPQHLYAHIISMYAADAMRALNLVYGATTIPNGAKSKIFLPDFFGNTSGGVELCKF